MQNKYDTIVVGAGHAGCEAAHAAAQLGNTVLLVTMNLETIAKMSCNPAMGGVAKGQIVREIDALGGMSGIITDKTMIQFRMLNRSKGPAMWSPRAQSDRLLFSNEWRWALEANANVHFFQDMVKELLIENNKVKGVITQMGNKFEAPSVILTNGTFMNGLIHIGRKNFGGGRMGENKSTGITEQLVSLGFETGRMKTGTPPRVDGRSLDYSKMAEQEGDAVPEKFSFSKQTSRLNKQRSCYITYTNNTVHDILREGFEDSPMFNGSIQSLGPRYCPSIEDKINRFAERDRHQIFVEPEGWQTIEMYINGFSTSLPEEIQLKAIQKIEGFEKARIFRPGYAIEYDFFPPTQLNATLETQGVEGLYFAGQINGTTGYEEAACQGLMAGINAALKTQNKEPLILQRSEAYIGVLIDDLINKGTNEPYRMFTSRAEYRILLRQDNADERLTPLGYKLGLADKERMEALDNKRSSVSEISDFLKKCKPEPADINPVLQAKNSSAISEKQDLARLLSRPQIHITDFKDILAAQALFKHNAEALQEAEILLKYTGYIEREQEMVKKMKKMEDLKIHIPFNYNEIKSLSKEAREKLTKQQPQTIGQASRVSGVSPADISILLVHFGK